MKPTGMDIFTTGWNKWVVSNKLVEMTYSYRMFHIDLLRSYEYNTLGKGILIYSGLAVAFQTALRFLVLQECRSKVIPQPTPFPSSLRLKRGMT